LRERKREGEGGRFVNPKFLIEELEKCAWERRLERDKKIAERASRTEKGKKNKK
jgi:hypothetical protein